MVYSVFYCSTSGQLRRVVSKQLNLQSLYVPMRLFIGLPGKLLAGWTPLRVVVTII